MMGQMCFILHPFVNVSLLGTIEKIEIESVGLVYFASPFGCEHKLGINGVRGPIFAQVSILAPLQNLNNQIQNEFKMLTFISF